jgi:ubiquinone/menaquinone biosynthesis C-methylase UbiE
MSIRTSVLKHYESLSGDYDHRFDNPRINYMRSVEKKVLPDILKMGLILDIGCGTGEQSVFLVEKGYRVLGVDISKEMLKIAKERIKDANFKDRISFIMASAEFLPFRDKSFEGIISIFGVFNHIPNVDHAFHETSRVLKTGGRAIFTVVNRWNLTWWVNAFIRCKGSWVISSLRSKEYVVNGLWTYYFSRGNLIKRLKDIGFKVRIGSLLLLIYPFNSKKLLLHEKMFIRFEDAVRWYYPFNALGYYHLVIVEK